MQTKGGKLDGMVFTNADPQYARILDNPQGVLTPATMWMEQVKKVMTVNQKIEEESSWV